VARKWKHLLSIALIVSLVAGMLPFVPAQHAQAAGYFTFRDFSTSKASPKEVDTRIVELAGTFTGVSPDSMSYKIEQLVGNTVALVKSVNAKPIISNNDYLFTGVELFDGLNQITVSGINDSSQPVSDVAYVYFANVPVISQVSLSDGRIMYEGADPLIAGPVQPALHITARNSDTVTVNGKPAFQGGANSFSIDSLGLVPGLNSLSIVASNGTKTYAVNRKLIYFNGKSTIYDLAVGSTLLDGNPTINGLNSGVLAGKLLVTLPGTGPVPGDPTVSVTIKRADGTVLETLTATVGAKTTVGNMVTFPFSTTPTSVSAISNNGDYIVTIRDNWNGITSDTDVKFRVRNTSLPYITGFKQLHDAVESGTSVTANSLTDFSGNEISVSKLPIYIEMEAQNYNVTTSTATSSVSAYLNGSSTPSVVPGEFDYVLMTRGTNRVFKITKMPKGKVELRFSISNPSPANTDTVSRKVDFLPVPSIQLNNLKHAMSFDTPDALRNLTNSIDALQGIRGELVNFGTADYSTFKVTLNGTVITHTMDASPSNKFIVNHASLLMAEGANVLVFTGTANGVPVSTTVTVYYFSKDKPGITDVKPVPVGESADPEVKFAPTQTKQYTTTEKQVDILFTIANADKLMIKVDGTSVASADSATSWTPSSPALALVSGSTWRFRSDLAATGPRSFSITVVKGVSSVTDNITIVRENPSFVILSPKLPQERVVNQNYLQISIKAEGAKKIEIGKTVMEKGAGDVFRLSYTGLKPGTNRVKFTVYQSDDGKVKVNGEFTVNYAGDNSVGAQYKTKLPSSGKLSVFNGAITLSFPKNTFLRRARTPGIPTNNSELFDSQDVLFGIADKYDGRTLKTVNTDGTISQVPTDPQMSNSLTPKVHFSLVSDLYWIDAGYMKKNLANEDVSVAPEHPYKSDGIDYVKIYQRPQTWWLEPSQRGQITLKYDPALRNVSANSVSIWRLNGLEWENIGGKVDSAKKTVTASFDEFGYYAVMSLNYSYNDIVSHGYGRDPMELLLSRGVMEAKDNSEFGAFDNITRGEFAQMLVKMANLELDYDEDVNKLTFTDVPLGKIPGTLWDYRYIETAARKGIIRGKTPRLFAPNDYITREQAAVMIARALNMLKGKENPDKDRAALQKLFTDANLIEDYNSISSVYAVAKAGYITGIPNQTGNGNKPTYRFDPRANLTRGDTAVITVRVMQKAKLL